MKVRKLSIKKICIFIGVVLVIVVGLIMGIKSLIDDKKEKATYEYKFSEKGYSSEEVAVFKEKLENNELDILLEKKYSKDYINLIKNEYFNFSNLDKYLEYLKEYDIDKSIAIVNVGADKDWYEDVQETDTSKAELMLVNKFYALKSDYVPETVLVSSMYAYAGKYVSLTIYDDLTSMLSRAKEEGYTLVVTQGYRSYKEQEESYNSYKSAYSTREADEVVARPGHSEYQTGLSLDIEPYNKKVEDVTGNLEYEWLINNSYKYGFVLRYEADKEDITGFKYNPWRFRYVGKTAARQMHDNDLTFDEYYMYYVN